MTEGHDRIESMQIDVDEIMALRNEVGRLRTALTDSGASFSDAELRVNGTDDLSFLTELRERVQDGFDRRDVGQIEFALKMIDDWICELTPNGQGEPGRDS